MEQVGRGDHVAYRILLDRHLQRIHAFADRVLHNPSEAEDVAQEVFLRLWKHASRWKPRGPKLSTWLHRIALNLCLNKKQRHRETPSENLPEMPDPENQPGRIADRHEMAQYVNDALLHLPTKQRAALTLCHYQGMRNKEAAEVLGVSIEALESLLARGRRTLKARLSLVATEFFDGNL